MVSKSSSIAINYLRGWFGVDLLAAVPFDLLYAFDVYSGEVSFNCANFDVNCAKFDVNCSDFDVNCANFDVNCADFYGNRAGGVT